MKAAAKSILSNTEVTGSNEYVHTNNFVPGAKIKKSADQMSHISKTQRQGSGFVKTFLDESKVNKNVARDLMNTKPVFSVQEIQGGQAQLNGASKTSRLAPVPPGGIGHQRNTSMGQQPQAHKELFDYKKTLAGG